MRTKTMRSGIAPLQTHTLPSIETKCDIIIAIFDQRDLSQRSVPRKRKLGSVLAIRALLMAIFDKRDIFKRRRPRYRGYAIAKRDAARD